VQKLVRVEINTLRALAKSRKEIGLRKMQVGNQIYQVMLSECGHKKI
jgi:hypothetical protein